MSAGDTRSSARFLFYAGKGGVGKTTCAAARAVIEAARGARVLVASTDPAHSLGDALMARLSSVPRAIRARDAPPQRRSRPHLRGTLHAVELSASKAFAAWLARNRGPLGEVLEHGTWLDREDVEAVLDLPLPGIDELAGMLELARLGRVDLEAAPDDYGRSRSQREAASLPYDVIIVDTAPTGHTLRLLTSPEAVLALTHALEDVQREHRIVRERFARVWRPDAADRLIALLAAQAMRLAEILRDRQRTTFHWVMLPEILSLAESENGVAAIEKRGIPVAHVIVNRTLPPGSRCPVCDARREEERRVIAALVRGLGPGRIIRVASARVREPRGIAALTAIGCEIVASRRISARAPSRRGEASAAMVLSVPPAPHFSPLQSLVPLPDSGLVMVAGKGGAGKSTVAAAVALALARRDPPRLTLLLSTDPAHSLGPVFDLAPGAVGDKPQTVPRGPANLFVRELDAVAALAVRRAELEVAFDQIASSFGARDSGRAAELFELAPPGVDELFGMLSILEASQSYPLVVVDMAPTGHALRLLEQPEAAQQWVHALMRVLLKYPSLARPNQLAQELLSISKSIRGLRELLHDRARTRVVVVTRPAAVPRLETARLLSELRRRKLPTSAIVANAMTLGPGRCVRCRSTASVERLELAALRRDAAVARGSVIIQTALAAPPPRGVAALERWSARWSAGVRQRR